MKPGNQCLTKGLKIKLGDVWFGSNLVKQYKGSN